MKDEFASKRIKRGMISLYTPPVRKENNREKRSDQNMNLQARMELAGQCLLAWLDPQKEFVPAGGYEVAHDVGRWWDAVLRLEHAIGFVIPAQLEGAMLRNLQRLTDNPDGLLMNRPDAVGINGPAKINPHNFREALLAFNALVRYRRSAWARSAGHRLLETMDRCLLDSGRFDFTKLRCWGQIPFTQEMSHPEPEGNGWFDSTGTSGRSLEALVWFFEATGDALALDLARRVAGHHLAYSTNKDGTIRQEIIDPENMGHDHSFQGTLRGLLLFGLLSGQREYVDVVAATYRNGLQQSVIKESGWAPHDLGKTRFPNEQGDPVAETASAGDAAQLALWLALRAGDLGLLDDVERLLRARILPAQITREDVHPDRRITPRELGGWGSHCPAHAGKGCLLDILAAVTHTLCDVHEHICTQSPMGVQVNLHFDYEDARVKVVASRNDAGQVVVFVKQHDNVVIRLPRWTPQRSVQLTVDGKPTPMKLLGSFVWISKGLLREHSEIVMTYELPERFSQEEMPSGRLYRFKWRGDEIVGVDPHDGPLPFYPALQHNSV